MSDLEHDKIHQQVRDAYAVIARSGGCGCGPSCCTPTERSTAERLTQGIGYSAEETAAVPEGANLGLGCGNPQAIANLKVGETVLDLGSGAGFDAFLAAHAVGPTGRVIGVDMTPDMLTKAHANAARGGYANVNFRLGEIEHLPVADATVDVIISNCVINLAPDKAQVCRDAWRVLKPSAPFTEAIPDPPYRRQQAILLLTDGQNVGGSGDGYKAVWGTGSAAYDEMNSRLLTLAGNVKADGVIVYVIQFANDDEDLKNLLKQVASGPDAPYYHLAQGAAELQTVFREVANHLTELRLSK